MLNINSIVTIIGSTGFLGNYVVKALAKTGLRINVVARNAATANHLKMFGAVGQISLINCDIKNNAQLEPIIKNSDYVINLVGILYNTRQQKFDTVHIEIPKLIARFSNKYKVKKLVHISALGVDRAITSKYAKSKLAGENEVRSNFSNATIFRPSVLFGQEDNFINMFNNLMKFSYIIPLIGGGNTKFQPIYVNDVANAIYETITDIEGIYEGNTYELGGPEILSLKDIHNCILKITGRKRLLFPIPFAIAKTLGIFLNLLPRPLLTPDQVDLLRYDNIVSGKNGLDVMNIRKTPLQSIITKYIY